MSKQKRISPAVFMSRARQMRAIAQAQLTKDELTRVIAVIADSEFRFDAYPLTPDEQALLRSVSAVLIQAVLGGELEYLAVIVRALYTAGIVRDSGAYAPLADDSAPSSAAATT